MSAELIFIAASMAIPGSILVFLDQWERAQSELRANHERDTDG